MIRLAPAALLFVAPIALAQSPWLLPSQREAHEAFEAGVNTTPAPDSLRAWHDLLGSEPHIAGTPGDERCIDKQVKAFTDLGLDVQVHEFWAYLCKPIDAKLEIIEDEPAEHPDLPHASAVRRGVVALPIAEDQNLLNDSFAAHPELTYGWNAYSGSGDVTANIVYANYGTKEDFETLKSLHIDCAGKIILARYGGNFRGYKVKFAERAGAVGVLIYTDPDDSGYRQGVTYPEGGWANDTCIQRGSINTLEYPGDPLTPGSPATENAPRLNPDDLDLPRIPVQPIGYRAAQTIMLKMNGAPLPQELVKTWQGGLPCAYRLTGGDDLKLHLLVKQERLITKSANIIATLKGAQFPDQKVIIGCHHDAWGFGAGDPLAGTIVLFEAAKSFARAAQQGMTPARTIVFATWGAEEFHIVGSTEYCEQYRPQLMREAIAYINLDAAAMGVDFAAAASPSLKTLIEEVARETPQARSTSNQTVYQAWRAKTESTALSIGNLGGGSDHIAFYCHLGVPSCGISSVGAPGTAYHSNYDNLAWYRKTIGDDYEPALMLTRIVNLMTARLANASLIPLDPTRYAADLREHIASLEERAEELEMKIDLRALRTAVNDFEHIASDAWSRVQRGVETGALAPQQLHPINAALLQLERAWLIDEGLPNRPWFKNLYASSDPDSGYAASMLPALRAALEAKDPAAVEAATSRYLAALERLSAHMSRMN